MTGRPKMTRLPGLLQAYMAANIVPLEDIAEYAGVSVRQADRWTKSDSEPSREKERLLAELLGVSPIDFYDAGAFADIPVSPGLYEEIRLALANLEERLANVEDGQQEILRVLSQQKGNG